MTLWPRPAAAREAKPVPAPSSSTDNRGYSGWAPNIWARTTDIAQVTPPSLQCTASRSRRCQEAQRPRFGNEIEVVLTPSPSKRPSEMGPSTVSWSPRSPAMVMSINRAANSGSLMVTSTIMVCFLPPSFGPFLVWLPAGAAAKTADNAPAVWPAPPPPAAPSSWRPAPPQKTSRRRSTQRAPWAASAARATARERPPRHPSGASSGGPSSVDSGADPPSSPPSPSSPSPSMGAPSPPSAWAPASSGADGEARAMARPTKRSRPRRARRPGPAMCPSPWV
mmetsp:Transcript_150989/g.485227  ORF Transcript_150989/g.485227 Transcript_150989/m.485227 type:complete len:280 (-) Transcript_150989:40-879(-)